MKIEFLSQTEFFFDETIPTFTHGDSLSLFSILFLTPDCFSSIFSSPKEHNQIVQSSYDIYQPRAHLH